MSAEFGKFKSTELGKCPFTGAGTPAKHTAGKGQTVKDFWPNSLNLDILSQHSSTGPIQWIKNLTILRNLKN